MQSEINIQLMETHYAAEQYFGENFLIDEEWWEVEIITDADYYPLPELEESNA